MFRGTVFGGGCENRRSARLEKAFNHFLETLTIMRFGDKISINEFRDEEVRDCDKLALPVALAPPWKAAQALVVG